MSLLNGLYGLLVLPESLPKSSRASFQLRRANPVGALVLLRSHRQLLGLAGVNVLAQLAHHVFTTVWVLYVADRYGWSPLWVGGSMAVVGLSSSVVSAAVVRPMAVRFGERATLLAGLFFGGLGMAIFGAAGQGWVFLAGIPVMCLWGLANPSIQGLMTRRVGPSEQGRLQGANASLQSLAGLFGPGLFSAVFTFALTRRDPGMEGLPFFLASAFLLSAMAVAWVVTSARSAAAQPAA